ncbi:hypothetical protein [Capnocytophaga sputigena]|jgi:hypothetical protein|uniref:hypothetical protein n=1 Tax=Capnocytophaga sputigena TaxID=1019 RepID=UPI0028D769D0|nr:hypothetical protein [Capnocytophaga sputigena]
MENPAERIEQFLSENPANIITVTQGTARLAKQASPKYGFTLQDIHTLYGSVSDFLKALPAKGFTTDVKIDLKRLYGAGAKQTTYKIETLTLNFKKETPMNEVAPAPTAPTVPSVPNAMGYPMGLGYTPVATTDWISSKVIEERYRDLLRDNDTLREDNKDLRSQLRTLNEEKASLRLQLDTAHNSNNPKFNPKYLCKPINKLKSQLKMKELDNIRDKQQLYRLYAKQYSQRKICQTINNIIQYYRPFCSNKCRRISNQEALTFIYLLGLPNGYTLHPHQATTLQYLKTTQRFQTFINTQQL